MTVRSRIPFFVAGFLTMLLWRCSSDSHVADVILHNGKIITVDSSFSIQEAIAIDSGRFLAVGSDDQIMKYVREGTNVIDLQGRTVIPGLIEGHAHPIAASRSELHDSIPVVTSIAEVLKWIERQVRLKDNDEWIIHPKFFITRMEDRRQITLRELDAVAPRNPVFLNGSYGGIVNTRALQLSELMLRKHPGILIDERMGRPSGLIRRSAFGLLALPPTPALNDQEKYHALKNLIHRYNSIGFTSIVSGGGPIEEMQAFRNLKQRGELTARIFHNVRVSIDPEKSQDELTRELRNMAVRTGDGDEWVKVGAFKVVLDGGMLTGTAFLHEGWGPRAKALYGINDPTYRGELMLSKQELVRIINAADAAGWKFTAHVTGGAAVDTLLAAYAIIHSTRPIRDKRFSIIHGNFFTNEAITKMAEMGIYADMQPAWYYLDTDLLQYVLGSERLKTFHPYQSLTKAGIIVNAGSDHMVKTDPDEAINPYNPFTAMWSVVTRKTLSGTVINSEQSVSREQALKMYTINNAFASFEEEIKGSIETGKLADLVVLSGDLLTCPEDSIRTLRPELTMVDGKVVYTTGRIDN